MLFIIKAIKNVRSTTLSIPLMKYSSNPINTKTMNRRVFISEKNLLIKSMLTVLILIIEIDAIDYDLSILS